jgi:hypothetical protein
MYKRQHLDEFYKRLTYSVSLCPVLNIIAYINFMPKTNTYDIIQITRDLSQAQRKVAIPMKFPLLVQRTTLVHH